MIMKDFKSFIETYVPIGTNLDVIYYNNSDENEM